MTAGPSKPDPGGGEPEPGGGEAEPAGEDRRDGARTDADPARPDGDDPRPTGVGEHTQIARRAGIVALGTLGSRVLGLVRDAVVAASFSVGATDAFYVAFTIPNALRVLLGEGAVSGAFIPVFAEVRATEGEARAKAYFANLAGTMTLVLGAVAVLGILLAEPIVELYASGYREHPGRFELTVDLTRWVFPYLFFIGLAALGMGILNAVRRFFVPAFSPMLLNVAMIAAPLVFISPAVAMGLDPIGALAIGVLVGGALQVMVQAMALRRAGMPLMPRLGITDPYVRKSLRLMVPLLAGLGVYQLNVLLSRRFASMLETGAQSYLYYSQRVVEMPQGMFALAIASAALPTLSDLRASGNTDELRRTFGYGLRLSLFVAVPSSVAIAIFAEPIVAALFGRGAFGPAAIDATARTLMWQALGVWAVASVRTVVPMFYAYNDTRSPVIGSAVNLLVFVGLCVSLLEPMAYEGIALALGAASAVQLMALLLLLRRRVGQLGLRSIGASLLRQILATLPMAAILGLLLPLGDFSEGSSPKNMTLLVVGLIAGGGAYLGAARLLGCPEFAELAKALRRKRPRR